MLRKASLLFFLLSALISSDLSAAKSFLAQDKFCLGCHPDIAKSKRIHLHLGCEKCHMISEGEEHAKNKTKMKLVQDIPFLCFNCHSEMNFSGRNVHFPVAKGMCDACHGQHISNDHGLLKNECEVCLRCHAIEKFTKKCSHKVAIGGCGKRCHNPHASDYPHLLSTDINIICIGCHSKQQSGAHIVALAGGTRHPIGGVYYQDNLKQEMNCASCHNPHSSDYAKLFARRSRCRQCHEY